MKLNLVILLLITSHLIHAQERNVFLEIGGSGGLGSINYEKTIWLIGQNQKHNTMELKPSLKWKLTFRVGLGTSPIDKNNGWVLVFPTMANLVYGDATKAHKLEIGTGLAPSLTTKGTAYVKSPVLLGYRFEPVDKLWFMRISYTPIFAWLVDLQWQHWAGISVGIKLFATPNSNE